MFLRFPSIFKNFLVQQGHPVWLGRQKLEINKLFVVLVEKVILVILAFSFGSTTLQLITSSLATQSTSDVHRKRRKGLILIICKNNQSASACIIAATSRRKRVWEKTKICAFVWVNVRDSEIENIGKHLCTWLWKIGRVKTVAEPTQIREKDKQTEAEKNSHKHHKGGTGRAVRSETGYRIYTTPPLEILMSLPSAKTPAVLALSSHDDNVTHRQH